MNHRNISFIKSFIRILAAGGIMSNQFLIGGFLLIVAEILGIVEEFYA